MRPTSTPRHLSAERAFHPRGTRRARLSLTLRGVLLALATLPAVVGGAPLRAAPDDPAEGARTVAAGDAAALEQAFGPPCDKTLPVPAVDLIAPLAELYTHYATARCHGAAGRLREAAQGFRRGLDAQTALPALWRWRLVQTHVLAGDHDAALRELEALLQAPAMPHLVQRTRTLVGALTASPGLAPESRHVDYLLGYLERVTPGVVDYDLLLRLWELAGRENNAALRESLQLLLWRSPKDTAAAARWTLPEPAAAGRQPPVTAADHLTRAERLFALGRFEQLARELESANLPPLDAPYANALGRLYFRALIRGNLLQHAAVQVNTTSVMQRYAFDRRQQLIWGMRIQLRRRMIGPTLKYLEELERLAPTDPELPGIFLELLRYNQGRHDTVTTLHWLERLATGFPNATETSDGYWQVIWDAVERGALAEATPLLEAAIAGGAGFHPVDQARLQYWRGRLRMRQGDQAGGEAIWTELSERWPYNYYTALAEWTRRGQQLRMPGPSADLTPVPEPAPQIKALWDVTPFPTAMFLYAVGEPELAYELLQDVVAKPLPPAALEEAGALFYYLERHYLAMRLVANHLMESLRRSRVDGSPLWRRAFPRPHWDVVQQQASAQQVDPYFVFAIMREESRFFPRADSSAGAKGLMQLMPATARSVAQRHGLPYEEELLHTPELNIPLGTLYLKRVLERFDGNVVYAAAAYNAGPTNVQRWVKRHGNLPLDEFVERIPFGETQRYVKRVFLSYMVYTQLYR